MRAFFAIVKLTLRNAVRSHLFQFLLGVLIVCSVLVPMTVSGDGTAGGFIQVALLYSLSAVSIVVALSSLWLSCYVMTQDIESYQLHMVVTKPVSRLVVWLGKWSGVLLLHTVLLVISAVLIYVIVLTQFSRQHFDRASVERVRNEVLVGRRVFLPEPFDAEAAAKEMLKKRFQELRAKGEELDMSAESQETLLREMRKRALAMNSEILSGQYREWTYAGLPVNLNAPMFLRYRVYIGKADSSGQRLTAGSWLIGVPEFERGPDGKIDRDKYQVYYAQYPPESIKSGEFYEKVIPVNIGGVSAVTPDGKVHAAFLNLDPQEQAQFFQTADGPKILIRETGFAANYARGIFVIFLEILILSALGCAVSAVFTMPTAIFLSISYLLFGSFASYMTESAVFNTTEAIGQFVGRVLLVVVIPIQRFEVTNFIAHGELIEGAFIWHLIWAYLICRALPICALGAWLYQRRELGLVVRK